MNARDPNPFFVLGLPTTATSMEIEREGRKILGLLEIGIASARTVDSPQGPLDRTPDLVRGAIAALQDPDRRLVHEFEAVAAGPDPQVLPPTWSDAFSRLGFRGLGA